MLFNVNYLAAFFFAFFLLWGCNQLKSDDEKIKDSLIGEYIIDDYVNSQPKSFKDDFGKSVSKAKYIFWEDGKFEYSANLEEVIFYDPMFQEDLLDDNINVKFIITGGWTLKDKKLNLNYNFDKLKFLTQDEDGDYSLDVVLHSQFENKSRSNLDTQLKIVDFDLSKITTENSKGERQSMNKSN